MFSYFLSNKEAVKKLVLLSLLGIFISLLSILTRDLKEVLIISELGATNLLDLKLSPIPHNLLFIFGFCGLSILFKRKDLFNLSILSFFVILITSYITKNLSLFYITADLFSTFGLLLFFYPLFNVICTFDDAKQFYPLIYIISSLVLLAASSAFLTINPQSHFLILLTVLCGGALWIHHTLASDYSKIRLSEFVNIFKSPVLYLIAFIVLIAHIDIKLLELLFKNDLNLYASSDKYLYNYSMNLYSLTVGVSSIFFAFVILILTQKYKIFPLLTSLTFIVLGGVYFLTHTMNLPIYLLIAIMACVKSSQYFMYFGNFLAYAKRIYAEQSTGRAIFEGLIGLCLGKKLAPFLTSLLITTYDTSNIADLPIFPIYLGLGFLMLLLSRNLSKRLNQ